MSELISKESRGRFEKTGEFFAVENGVAYGFAIVCTDKGKPYWDLQDDHIPEAEMEAAALDFMKSSRVGSDQHTGEHVGDIVFGFPITSKSNTLGIATEKTGFLIGYQPQDPVHLDMIAAGERTGFSIGGLLLDFDVSDVGKAVWSTAFQNNLPDSSFLYVKPGGKKDSGGKTTPRSNRMFPVKDAEGKVDAAHLNNALARIPQSSLSADLKAKLTAKAESMKTAKLAKGSPDPGDVYSQSDMGEKKPKRGKVYRRFKIDEISLVTAPAQEGATVGYVKGANIVKLVSKSAVITSEEEGHQHVVDLDDVDENGCGCTSYARADGEDYGHGHDFIVDAASGSITIAANSGHSHTAEMPDRTPMNEAGPAVAETVHLAAPSATNLTPRGRAHSVQGKSTPLPEQPTMTEQEIAALKARTERAEKMAELNDAQRAYFKALSASDGEAFISKSATDREALVKSAVEFTSADGVVYYKHDDPRTIAMAKKADDLTKSLAIEKGISRKATIAKAAAEDLGGCPGTDEVHVAVMEAVESIPDEALRKGAREMIKGLQGAIKKAGTPSGSTFSHDKRPDGTGDELAKAEGALKTAVDAFAKANSIADYAVAFTKATQVDAATREAYQNVSDLRGRKIA